ncbi:MAG: hypothetical protein LBI45_04455 [Bacteroidales bacterium]|jgi:hypothetical protein|nr:hypothetical protein [Bacteroidales bacterium]
MKYVIKIFIIIVVATICLTACEKSYHYIVEGRLIDKITREPVEGIMVSFNKYDIIHPKNGQKTQKKSPIGQSGWSDENGKFRALETYSTSILYIYGYSSHENGLYKDTTLLVDFSNVTLSGTPSKNYKGDYVLNIGDFELEK